jgi:ABC-type nitrate/sulfonate/bicarbonate transport system permease component
LLANGRFLLGPLGVAGALLTWEVLSRADVLPSRSFPPATAVARALFEETAGAELWIALGQTLEGWALGLGLASALAVPLGILIGSSRLLYGMSKALIEFLRPIPSVALIPLAVLVYGTGLQTKLFLVTFASFWPILFQAIYGVQDVDPVAQDTARAFGFGRMQRLLRVTLPSAAPYIATGLRISSSVALVLAVTAELIVGVPGVGKVINAAQSGGAYALMYALIVVAGLLGLLLNLGFRAAERRLLRWHPSQREEAPV